AGLLAFLRARVVRGAAFVLKACEAERRVARADLVLTGEGRLDRTSFYGKAPIELARLARRLGTPVAMVCGSIEPSCRPRLARLGVRRAVALSEAGATPEGSLRDAARWAARAAALACSG
ncbi:MAG: glycerate kinase, partial [Elusimicrobia bacterium]|nr:glycerate kinase [Elusimicrobiota bacterium]